MLSFTSFLRRTLAEDLTSALPKRFALMPLDMLLKQIIVTDRKLPIFEYVPSLFQHMGVRSTFAV